jgi:pyruvate/2-oxoglutarate/acetoin dehydrogenase E1 component
LNEALAEEMEQNDKVFILGEEVSTMNSCVRTGLNRNRSHNITELTR